MKRQKNYPKPNACERPIRTVYQIQIFDRENKIKVKKQDTWTETKQCFYKVFYNHKMLKI